jgi:hypothetical protein
LETPRHADTSGGSAYELRTHRYRRPCRHLPVGLTGIFVAILVFAAIYAKASQPGRGAGQGAQLGLLFAIFMEGAFVAVNYATINISTKLGLELAASELIEWTLVGIVVGLIYKPASAAPPSS